MAPEKTQQISPSCSLLITQPFIEILPLTVQRKLHNHKQKWQNHNRKSHIVLPCFDNIKVRQIFWSQETGISILSGASLWFSPPIRAQDSFLSVVVIAPDSDRPHIRVVLVLLTGCTTIIKPKPHNVRTCTNKSFN